MTNVLFTVLKMMRMLCQSFYTKSCITKIMGKYYHVMLYAF